MNDFVKRLIKEHADLIVKISKLDDFMYGNGGINIHTYINNNKTQDELFKNMTEYANKAIQLSSMRTYLKALECRMTNLDIVYDADTNKYYQGVAMLALTDDEEQTK